MTNSVSVTYDEQIKPIRDVSFHYKKTEYPYSKTGVKIEVRADRFDKAFILDVKDYDNYRGFCCSSAVFSMEEAEEFFSKCLEFVRQQKNG